MSSLLEYETQIFLDSYHDDGLLIMAKGLGIERLFLNLIKLYLDPENLVIILNTSKSEEEYFLETLISENTDCLPKIINNETPSSKRYSIYLQGGVLFVSTRIFIVDMLTENILSSSITGILFYRAHKMTEKCQESFAIRLYREKNKEGFIKAFSDNPAAFNRGFLSLEKVMKSLYLRHLNLWPRFHSAIISYLEEYKPNVIEVRIKQTQVMHDMQMAILDLIQLCIKEFKVCNPTIMIPEINMENIISKSFHNIIRVKLEPLWDQLTSKTKGLISSFKTLKQLLINICRLDSLTFFQQLQFLREQSMSGSNLSSDLHWMLEPPAEILYMKAQQRAGSKGDSKKNNLESDRDPKLKILWQILTKITNHEKDSINADDTFEENEKKPIVVIIKDEYTSSQVREYLVKLIVGEQNIGIDDAISHNLWLCKAENGKVLLRNALKFKCESADIIKDKNVKSSKNEKTSKKKINQAKSKKSLKLTNTKKKLKISSHQSLNNQDQVASLNITKFLDKRESELNCDEPIESILGNDSHSSEDLHINEDDSKSISKGTMVNELCENIPVISAISTEKSEFKPEGAVIKLILPTPITVDDIPAHMTRILEKYKPGHVILYDPDISFVRQLEVYQARYPQTQIDIYFLIYSDSAEEQRYLLSLKSEKEAFEQLIQEKGTMMLPADVEGKGTALESDLEQVIETGASTRKAGGQIKTFLGAVDGDSTPTVIIDVREFNSELPGWLHTLPYYPTAELALSGIGCKVKILPVTLVIGDYLLTPELCVERKSINDLVQSLNSGRLYTQVKAMSRRYAKPALLVEFDSDVKPFVLQARQSSFGVTKSSSTLSTEISVMDIQSKMVLLTRHFPKLRLLWCCDPKMAAELFLELKRGKPEPVMEEHSGVGSDEGSDKVAGEDISKIFGADSSPTLDDKASFPTSSKVKPNDMAKRHAAYDALCKMPGVSSKNCAQLARKAKSLKGLCLMSKEELTLALSNSAEAGKLYDFLRGN